MKLEDFGSKADLLRKKFIDIDNGVYDAKKGQ